MKHPKTALLLLFLLCAALTLPVCAAETAPDSFGPVHVSGNLGSLSFDAARIETRTLTMQSGPDDGVTAPKHWEQRDVKMIVVQPGSSAQVSTEPVRLRRGQSPDTFYAETYNKGSAGYYIQKEMLVLSSGARQDVYYPTMLPSGPVDLWFNDQEGYSGDLYYVAMEEARYGFAEEYFIVYGGEQPAYSETGFTDIPAGAYYEDAVRWAKETGVTNGITETLFSPKSSCTRGQGVTFLWRAAGCPEPKTTVNPFTDVKEGSAFYKAILWAYENGITNGLTAATFYPEGECTRSHVLTFLWRAQGKPAASGTFADVLPAGYYTDALNWADSNGLMKDTPIEGNPGAYRFYCPRAEMVTYLYRYFG